MDNSQEQKPKLPNIDNYVDVEGVSTKKLNIGLWYVEHIEQFKRGIIIFFAVVGGISWLYTIYGFGSYIFKGMKEDDILAGELTSSGLINYDYFAQIAPVDLKTGPVHSLKAGTKYDLAMQVSNPNQRHWGEFEYFLVADGKEIGRESGFILPGETKYVMALSKEAASQNIQLRIENVGWHRIKTREIDNWNEFRNSRLDIKISEIDFAHQVDENLNRLSFKVGNDTAFNYWNVDFLIVLLNSQGNIVGVNKYGLSELMSGDKIDINMVWSGALPQVSQIIVSPEVNIMKSSAYMQFEGGIGEEK